MLKKNSLLNITNHPSHLEEELARNGKDLYNVTVVSSTS